jgi:hypothetical protein
VLTIDLLDELERLRALGTGVRKMAVLLGVSRNTVRRYVRGGAVRRPASVGGPSWFGRAVALYDGMGTCAGNATAVARILDAEGVVISARSVQRAMKRRPA